MTQTTWRLAAAVTATATLLSGACAAKPRERPIYLGDVGSGPGSLDHARQQLQGRWEFVSLDRLFISITNERGETTATSAWRRSSVSARTE